MVPPRKFPNPVAVFTDRLLFTTLEQADVSAAVSKPYTHPLTGAQVKLFTLDKDLRYISFASDHGPYNMAMTYDACLALHAKLTDERYSKRAICLYSSPCPKMKSNAALLIALYHLIVEKHQPWRAFSPLAKMELMPFRDAGGLPADFHLSVQDVLWGTWKAMRLDLLSFQDFDPAAYKFYELVENGDFNWVTQHFIAFASPLDPDFIAGNPHPLSSAREPRTLSKAFTNCLEYFQQHKIGVVVRLNDALYDYREFTDRGITHVDMFFPDGSNPSDEIVRAFIDLAEKTVSEGLVMAVHCKAGLGRTGALIGAYLIYKYGFTASEAIGLMRLLRPGMVVGNQQHFMALNQVKWLQWAAVDHYKAEIAASSSPSPSRLKSPSISPPGLRSLVDTELEIEPSPAAAAAVPIDAPGQPRKSPARLAVTPLKGPLPLVTDQISPSVSSIVERSSSPSFRTSTPPATGSAILPSSPATATATTRRGSRPPESSPERPTKRRPSQPLQEQASPLQVPSPLPRSDSADSSYGFGSKLRRFAVRDKTPETPPRKRESTAEQTLTPNGMTTGSPGLLGVGMLRGLRRKSSMTNVS